MRTFASRNERGGAFAIGTVILAPAVFLITMSMLFLVGYIEAKEQAGTLAIATATAATAQTAIIKNPKTGKLVLSVDCADAQEEASKAWGLVRDRIRTPAGVLLVSPEADWEIDLEPIAGKLRCQGLVSGVNVSVRDTYRGNEYTQWLGWELDFTVRGRAQLAGTQAAP